LYLIKSLQTEELRESFTAKKQMINSLLQGNSIH